MRVLFDHNVPYNLRPYLLGHSVSTSAEMGWSELTNGQLIRAAEQGSFDLFVTCDQDIAYQQNLLDRRIAIVEITKNNWPSIEPALKQIVSAIDAAKPNSYQTVECTYVHRSRKRTP